MGGTGVSPVRHGAILAPGAMAGTAVGRMGRMSMLSCVPWETEDERDLTLPPLDSIVPPNTASCYREQP
jgi:hypothetical protein